MNTPSYIQKTLIGIVAVIILAVIGFFFWKSSSSSGILTDTGNAPVSTTTSDGKVETLPLQNVHVTPPDISAVPQYGADVSSTQKTAIEKQLKSVRAQMAKDKNDSTLWLTIGTLYKQAGDYAMAEKIWTYTAKAWPGFVVPPLNLADLYASYLHDYAKAEKAYLAAIKVNPAEIDAYVNLYGLYTSGKYKTPADGEKILRQGIEVNPSSYQLHLFLARHLAKYGSVSSAKAEYAKAASLAQAQGNATVAIEITAESKELK